MEGPRQMKRRKMDKWRCWYSTASLWLMVGLIAFTLYRIAT